jgi:hypothetical protein
MGLRVNVDNFARAETDRMFASILADSGGVNRWMHVRTPTPLDHQPVIRMNRDTLYSGAVVDLTDEATLTLPDAAGRYISAMVVNENHYVNAVLHEPGEHRLTVTDFDSPYVLVAVRILVDPTDSGDVAAVNALQDELRVTAGSATQFAPPVYDDASLTDTRKALLELARGLGGFARAFGRRDGVDPLRHLIATAAGWGGLPEQEAYYVNVDPGLPIGAYALTLRDVPVDGFWSISLYDAEGYFPRGTGGKVSINSLTATHNRDGSVAVNFGGTGDRPNLLTLVDGWNYLVRLYRPRKEILEGAWTFPSISRA